MWVRVSGTSIHTPPTVFGFLPRELPCPVRASPIQTSYLQLPTIKGRECNELKQCSRRTKGLACPFTKEDQPTSSQISKISTHEPVALCDRDLPRDQADMTDSRPAHELLHSNEPTPIAQLCPDISDQTTRILDGTLTIVWPFSVVSKSIAFILAERDFRLRRERGQVRIKFRGAAATAIAESGVAGGDDIRLSLGGVRWEKNETQTQLAGSTLEWQLEFTNRLLLNVRKTDSDDVKLIEVDVPDAEVAAINGNTQNTDLVDNQLLNSGVDNTPPQSPERSLPAKRPATEDPQEFASPAFIKRARMSYGALYEGGLDIFDESSNKKNKARKRSRFSLPANAWRYSSRSPSPEVDEEPELGSEMGEEKDASGDHEDAGVVDVSMSTPSRLAMVDEGCQTIELDFPPSANVQVSAEARFSVPLPYATPTPMPRTKMFETSDAVHDRPLGLEAGLGRHPNSLETGFLGHSPSHVGDGLGFEFTTSQATMYPVAPDMFAAPHAENDIADAVQQLGRVDEYPTEFLDADSLHPATVHSHPLLHTQMSDAEQAPAQTGLSFEADSEFYPNYPNIPQPQHSGWTIAGSSAYSLEPSHNDRHALVDIPSSPALVEQDAARERNQTPLGNLGGEVYSEPLDENEDDYVRDDALEVESEELTSEDEAQYEDGGDRPGDDYDLRNYDRAHDDDDDLIEEPEQAPPPEKPEIEVEPIDAEYDEVNDESDDGNEEDDESDESNGFGAYNMGNSVRGLGPSRQPEYGEIDGDQEGEYYSDEEDYSDEDSDEDEDEEEEKRAPPVPAAAKEPVFISLLSDSEDDDEPEPQAKQTEPESAPLGRTTESRSQLDPQLQPELQTIAKEDIRSDIERSPSESREPSEEQKPSEPLDITEFPEQARQFTRLEDALEIDEENVQEKAQEARPDNTNIETEPSEASAIVDAAATAPSHQEPRVEGPTEPDSTSQDLFGQSPPSSSPEQEGEDDQDTHQRADDGMDVETIDSPGKTALAPVQVTEVDDEAQDTTMELAEARDEVETASLDAVSPVDEMNVDEVRDEIRDKVETAPLNAVSPVDEMDVDEDVGMQPGEEEDATPQVIDDTMEFTTEVLSGADVERSEVGSNDGEEVLSEVKVTELTEVEVSVEIRVTPGSPPQSSSVPQSLPASAPGTPLAEEAVETAPEKQGHGQGQGQTAQSPDATLHETMQLATGEQTAEQGEHRPPSHDVEEFAQVDEDEAVEIPEGNQQLPPDTPFSPPPTQRFQSQPPPKDSYNTDEAGASQVSNTDSTQDKTKHLPTPGDTQEEVEATTHYPAEPRDSQDLEDDADPNDQIMAEFLQHSSPVSSRIRQPHENLAAEASPAPNQPGHLGAHGGEPSLEVDPRAEQETGQGSDDVLISVKPLRSSHHRSTRSSDLTNVTHADPSLALAKTATSATQRDDVEDESSPPGTLRVTRSRTADPSDPSIQLAKALPQATDEIGKGNSPQGTLRVTRSKADHTDPSIQLAKAPAASTRSARRQKTPDLPPRETRASSRGLQRGETPDSVLALLKSPSVAESTAEDENASAIKLQLLKSLRTSLPDFLPLKSLRNALNKRTDILAIATTTPPQPHRPKHGPRDYMLTLTLTDPSVAPTSVSVAHIFRPHQASLPIVHAGDVVLLRRFNVVSMKGRGFGIRAGESSAWAVFEKADEEMLAQIKGPPVEYSEQEKVYAEVLRRWWNLLDEKALEKIERANRWEVYESRTREYGHGKDMKRRGAQASPAQRSHWILAPSRDGNSMRKTTTELKPKPGTGITPNATYLRLCDSRCDSEMGVKAKQASTSTSFPSCQTYPSPVLPRRGGIHSIQGKAPACGDVRFGVAGLSRRGRGGESRRQRKRQRHHTDVVRDPQAMEDVGEKLEVALGVSEALETELARGSWLVVRGD
ncbi:hypothetical protein G7046_g2835 [Stylonectria norvegica]|nr:hypothetical protein G7046_g2835 [Stylonectria norvegica]